MTRIRSLTRVIISLAALCLVGCQEPSSPEGALRGTFALRSVDSKPLPLLQNDYSLTREFLAGDTLVFDGRGGLDEITVSRIDSVQSADSRLERSTRHATYRIRHDMIEFPAVCPPFTMCFGPPVGWMLPNGDIRTAYRLTDGLAQVKLYARVR